MQPQSKHLLTKELVAVLPRQPHAVRRQTAAATMRRLSTADTEWSSSPVYQIIMQNMGRQWPIQTLDVSRVFKYPTGT